MGERAGRGQGGNAPSPYLHPWGGGQEEKNKEWGGWQRWRRIISRRVKGSCFQTLTDKRPAAQATTKAVKGPAVSKIKPRRAPILESNGRYFLRRPRKQTVTGMSRSFEASATGSKPWNHGVKKAQAPWMARGLIAKIVATL